MSRNSPRFLALAAVLLVCAALAFLYVIRSERVHEAAPDSLAGLAFEPTPQALPVTSFLDGQGHPWSLRAEKGRMVILNLWATWCVPCVKELPALGRLKAALDGENIAIVAVNVGHDDAAKTAAFLKAHGAGNLAVYRDPDLSALTAFGTQGLPFSLLVDAQGREFARALGAVPWDDRDAVAYLRALAERAP